MNDQSDRPEVGPTSGSNVSMATFEIGYQVGSLFGAFLERDHIKVENAFIGKELDVL